MKKHLDTSLPIFISADNQTIENILPENKISFRILELYNLIGCELVEIVALYDDTIMILDEEGKLKSDRIVNKIATDLYSVDRMNEEELQNYLKALQVTGFAVILTDSDLDLPHNTIVGNVIICQNKYFQ